MKKLTVLLLLLLTACGTSNRDLYGKWKFADLQFLDPKTAPTDSFEADQIKDLYQGMTFHFEPDNKVTMEAPVLTKEIEKGTFELQSDDVLKLTYSGGEMHSYKIVKVKERELQLESLDARQKDEPEVRFIFKR